MDRRRFLRNAALVATGAVAADQLELLDRLGWVRRFFAGFGVGARSPVPLPVTQAMWDALLREDYLTESIVEAMHTVSPFRAAMIRPKPLHVPDRYVDEYPVFRRIEVVRS